MGGWVEERQEGRGKKMDGALWRSGREGIRNDGAMRMGHMLDVACPLTEGWRCAGMPVSTFTYSPMPLRRALQAKRGHGRRDYVGGSVK